MPLVRYEIRNEYSLANPELYRAANKDDAQALLEGVAMAGLVGILRQLGDLAEFAAEIFHDLHEEVMVTAARGHRLMVRVQQLETEFSSVEKALMSETNQIHFAYATGADWHASIWNDQNHLTQGDLPRFILNSYEECRGPPRLFLLDKFDVAGAGACLKRYTDPSFFKMEWASWELMKAEKAQRERKARRLKKKGRRRQNGETPNIVPKSQLNSRIRYSSRDLDGPKYVPGNSVSTFSQKLKSKQVNGSLVIDQEITRMYTQGSPFNLSSPKDDDHGSPLQDRVTGKVDIQGPSSIRLHKEDSPESPSQEFTGKPLAGSIHGVEFRDNLASVPVPEYQSLKSKADAEVERTTNKGRHGEQKDVPFNGESEPVTNAGEDQTDEVRSEADNYMDALTTMESEMETDSESRTKHEVDSDVNSEHKETGFEGNEELHEQRAPCSNFVDAEASTAFYNCELSTDSLKVESTLRFFNTESGEGSANIESTIASVNGISEDDLANVELPTCLTSASESVGMSNNDSSFGHDNGITSISILDSLSSENLNNDQIPASEERPSGTDIPSAIDMDAVSHRVFGKVQTTDVLSHGSSAAFENATPSIELDNGEASFRLVATKLSIVSTDMDLQTPPNKALLDVLNAGSSTAVVNVDTGGVSVIGPPSAEIDNGEASFRLATSESLVIRTDMDLQTSQNKEQLAVAESSAESSGHMVTDVKLQVHPPEVDKVDDPVFYGDCNINESAVVSDTSESVSGIGNAAMQDEYECTKLHAENAENRASPKTINSESFHCQSTELPTGFSLSKSVGQISVESDIQIVYNGTPADSGMLSDSALADFPEHAIDAELIEDEVCSVLSTDSVTPIKSVVGIQENGNPEESTCAKSTLDVMPMGLPLQLNMPSDFQDAQMPENHSSKILTAKTSNIESVVDSLGNKSMASFESSNVLVNVLVKDSSNDHLVKEIDLAQPVLADSVHAKLASADICREGLPNESIKAESDSFPGSEIPRVCLDAMFPATSLHANDIESQENLVTFEPHTDVPDEVFNAKSPRSSFDEKPAVCSFSTHSGAKLLNTVSLLKPIDAIPYTKAESPPNPPSVEAPDTELPSPPLEHIKISFHSAAELPHSTYATSSHHVGESPTSERCRLYESQTDDLSSSFHLLPEPAIPLQQGDENEGIGDLGSLSSRRQRKSSEIIPDKAQFSQIIDPDNDSENGDLKECEKSSSNSPGNFFNQPLEPPSEFTGFSGVITAKNEDTGSPRALSDTSMLSSSSPDSTQSTFLPKLKCPSADAGSRSPHSSNISMGSSSRSPIFSALHCPMSPEGTYHNIESFSRSQSTDLESELLVPTSPTLEPKFLVSDLLNEMPPLPPLPPLEWRIVKPRQRPSLPLMEAIEPATPPAPCPMVMPDSPDQDPSTSHLVPVAQKVPIEQKDSLIEAIASHDKTVLKKVTKQTRPISTKPLDDREVLLEQIRTRSFSLRHTVVVKNSIPRPATNINVAAILEKANAIRQAFAGSDGDDDDDDDDDWSDA